MSHQARAAIEYLMAYLEQVPHLGSVEQTA
jgi:hypothetical protein